MLVSASGTGAAKGVGPAGGAELEVICTSAFGKFPGKSENPVDFEWLVGERGVKEMLVSTPGAEAAGGIWPVVGAGLEVICPSAFARFPSESENPVDFEWLVGERGVKEMLVSTPGAEAAGGVWPTDGAGLETICTFAPAKVPSRFESSADAD